MSAERDKVDEAVAKLARQQEIERLAALDPIDYDSEREAAADKLNCRLGTLDKEVEAVRASALNMQDNVKGEGRRLTFVDVKPAEEPVEPAALVKEIAQRLQKHVVLTGDSAVAIALYIMATPLIDVAHTAPRLLLKSPTKRCGKTTLLNVIAKLAHRSLVASSISGAAVYRVIEESHPTLLLDEADTFLKQNVELGGVVNSGHSRTAAQVVRMVKVGESMEVRTFDTFAMMVVASIRGQADTFEDRSIVIPMKRRTSGERADPLEDDDLRQLTALRGQIARFADDYRQQVAKARRHKIPGTHDRIWDNWWPLMAVAAACGPKWVTRAEQAAQGLSEEQDDEALGEQLLADIKEVFERRDEARVLDGEKIFSSDLVTALVEMDGHPWAECGRMGKPLTQNQLARLLKPFGVTPKQVRIGTRSSKGYSFLALSEAFSRYLLRDE